MLQYDLQKLALGCTLADVQLTTIVVRFLTPRICESRLFQMVVQPESPKENTVEDLQVAQQPSAEPALVGSLPPVRSGKSRVQALDLFQQPQLWTDLISGNRPVELEIGSGKGLFLQRAAEERSQHDFVGIELAAKFANRAAQSIARNNLANVKMLRGDAQSFVQDVVPDAAVVRVHVFFPDPWWRNKHKKRRVLNEATLANIQRVLQVQGEFHFWTDVLDYYEHICSQVMDLTKLTGPRYVPQRAATHSMDYTTHFERRARTHGQPVYRAVFVKPN